LPLFFALRFHFRCHCHADYFISSRFRHAATTPAAYAAVSFRCWFFAIFARLPLHFHACNSHCRLPPLMPAIICRLSFDIFLYASLLIFDAFACTLPRCRCRHIPFHHIISLLPPFSLPPRHDAISLPPLVSFSLSLFSLLMPPRFAILMLTFHFSSASHYLPFFAISSLLPSTFSPLRRLPLFAIFSRLQLILPLLPIRLMPRHQPFHIFITAGFSASCRYAMPHRHAADSCFSLCRRWLSHCLLPPLPLSRLLFRDIAPHIR